LRPGLLACGLSPPLTNGLALILSSADPDPIARIRALGFFGCMTRGGHHQPHHLAIARGDLVF
jgi:hypothetical protein